MKNEDTVQLYEALVEAGKEFDMRHFGSYAVNSLRLEKGFRLWGAEVCFYFSSLDSRLALNGKCITYRIFWIAEY